LLVVFDAIDCLSTRTSGFVAVGYRGGDGAAGAADDDDHRDAAIIVIAGTGKSTTEFSRRSNGRRAGLDAHP
jgi:hypothetical protein